MVRFTLILITAGLMLSGCLLREIPSIGEPAPPTLDIPFTLVAPPTDTSTAAPPTSTLPPPPTPRADAIGPYSFAPNVNPLTGLTMSDPAVLDHRPMVVKISNAPPLVRPQAGIGAADVVFEHYAEGGLTRFSAVFYSQIPERVGSIRSARLIDYELAAMYQALFVYSGASNGVNAIIAASDFAERAYMGIQYGQPYYFRDETIPVPHNLFVNLAALSQLATAEGLNERPTLTGMAFLDVPPPDPAGDANAINIRYIATQVRWEWDAEHGVYRRISDGQGHFDALTGEQVTAENVVILFADHRFSDIVESEFQGNVSYGLEIALWFQGSAILFRDGKRYDGVWLRPTRESMIQLRTNDDQLLYFKPGTTWFQVIRYPDKMDPNEESFWVE